MNAKTKQPPRTQIMKSKMKLIIITLLGMMSISGCSSPVMRGNVKTCALLSAEDFMLITGLEEVDAKPPKNLVGAEEFDKTSCYYYFSSGQFYIHYRLNEQYYGGGGGPPSLSTLQESSGIYFNEATDPNPIFKAGSDYVSKHEEPKLGMISKFDYFTKTNKPPYSEINNPKREQHKSYLAIYTYEYRIEIKGETKENKGTLKALRDRTLKIGEELYARMEKTEYKSKGKKLE